MATVPTSKKRRRAISHLEKKALRRYYFEETNRQPTYDELQTWFHDQYDHTLSKSSLTDILRGDKYKHLDDNTLPRPNAKKNREAAWPDHDAALFEWQQRMQSKRVPITGELLKAAARRIWLKLPQYDEADMPGFSNGWLDGFKKRNGLRLRVCHGEAGAVDVEAVGVSLEDLRSQISSYHLDDVYNMDETAMYWKNSPDRSIATMQMSGGKVDKARITANFCCNATGTNKVPIWFIGTAANPRCFRKAHVLMKNLAMEWRHNQKGWMTGVIFAEWLRWFNSRVAGRSVALLVDGFSAHHTGLEMVKVNEELTNVKVRTSTLSLTSQITLSLILF